MYADGEPRRFRMATQSRGQSSNPFLRPDSGSSGFSSDQDVFGASVRSELAPGVTDRATTDWERRTICSCFAGKQLSRPLKSWGSGIAGLRRIIVRPLHPNYAIAWKIGTWRPASVSGIGTIGAFISFWLSAAFLRSISGRGWPCKICELMIAAQLHYHLIAGGRIQIFRFYSEATILFL